MKPSSSSTRTRKFILNLGDLDLNFLKRQALLPIINSLMGSESQFGEVG